MYAIPKTIFLGFIVANLFFSISQAENIAPTTQKRIPWIKPATLINTIENTVVENKIENTPANKQTIPAKKINPEPKDKKLYSQASQELYNRQYAEAIKNFELLIKKHPQSQYVADSHYWIAETNYISGNYKTAVDKYKKLLANHPGNSNAPMAMLRIGLAYSNMKKWEEARIALNKTISKYPNTGIIKLAQNQLDKNSWKRR